MSKNEQKAKTMADVARLAGVSASTASRALRNSPLISQQTIDKVQAIAKKHAYRPHLGARNFRLKKSNVIVLILPFNYADAEVLVNPYIFKIIGTIGSTLREHGYDLLLSQMDSIGEQIDDRYNNINLTRATHKIRFCSLRKKGRKGQHKSQGQNEVFFHRNPAFNAP